MNILTRSCLSLALLATSTPIWCQDGVVPGQQVPGGTGGVEDVTGGAPAEGTSGSQAPMITPFTVDGREGYALAFASEARRSNYLRGDVVLGIAYDDNAFFTGGKAAGDVSYSVAPSIAFDRSGARLHWTLSYSPGFTFYQRYTSYNQANQNLGANFSYRLSPHLTFAAQEGFARTSGLSNQFAPNEVAGSSGVVQAPNQTIVAPVADTIADTSTARLSYQFSRNAMIGATGNFSKLQYPNHGEVTGLFDSNVSGGGAFYNHRISRKNYIGATYQFQKYLSRALNAGGQTTQAHSLVAFYTFYIKPTLLLSFFGGPQHSETYGFGILASNSWSPSAGGSLSWQGQHTSGLIEYSRRISDGGGLQGAVTSDGADASLRHEFTRSWSVTIGTRYATNKVLDSLPIYGTSGHSASGTAAVQRVLGEHFNITLGYLRLRQSYDRVASISSTPDRDRVWLSIAYQFERPLGR